MAKFPRRSLLRLAVGAALPAGSRVGWAQAYLTRPVHLIVGFPPGGPNDILARLMGQWLSERLGQPIVVENRPGASSNVAADVVARAAPDGYTLFMTNVSNAINATLYDNLPFDFSRDIAPIAGIVQVPYVMEVHPDFPVNTVSDFISYAKANPGKVNFASAGIGTGIHMSGELFKMMTGINMLHIPYRGSAPALTDLMAGQVQVMFDSIPSSIGYLKANKLKALGVTSAVRSEALPNISVIGDTVKGYQVTGWFGLGAPAKTPAEIINKLNKETNAVLADPNTKARLAEMGGIVLSLSPSDFGTLITNEVEKWAAVVKFSGAKAE